MTSSFSNILGVRMKKSLRLITSMIFHSLSDYQDVPKTSFTPRVRYIYECHYEDRPKMLAHESRKGKKIYKLLGILSRRVKFCHFLCWGIVWRKWANKVLLTLCVIALPFFRLAREKKQALKGWKPQENLGDLNAWSFSLSFFAFIQI